MIKMRSPRTRLRWSSENKSDLGSMQSLLIALEFFEAPVFVLRTTTCSSGRAPGDNRARPEEPDKALAWEGVSKDSSATYFIFLAYRIFNPEATLLLSDAMTAPDLMHGTFARTLYEFNDLVNKSCAGCE